MARRGRGRAVTLKLTSDIDGLKAYLRALADMSWRHLVAEDLSQDRGLAYSGIHDYVLDRGRLFNCTERLTDRERYVIQRAAKRARQMWSCSFETKECFFNAQALVMGDDRERLKYCEGFAIGHFMPCHHAWVTINDKVVDLTWPSLADAPQAYGKLKDPLERRILGAAPEGFVYFGCDDLTDADDIHERILSCGVSWSFLSGEGHPDDVLERFQQPRKTPRATSD